MVASVRSPAMQYVMAIVMVAVAAVATRLMGPWTHASLGPLFLLAVAVSAWAGGMWPGLVATACSFGVIAGLVATRGKPGDFSAVQILQIVSLLPVGLFIGLLYAGRARAREALRERDARLQRVSEQIPGGLWSTDTALRVTSGFGIQSELLSGPAGTSLYDHFRTDDPHFAPVAAHRRALDGEPSTYELQWAGRTFQCHVEPLRGADRNTIGVVGVATDITDRKGAEEERERLMAALEVQHAHVSEAKRELESANQSKDRFLATLSHELRTPLTPVLALASALGERRDLPDDLRDDLETIRRNAALEATLIDDLLDVTRIARGKLPLNLHDVDVHEVLRNTVAICRPDVDAKQITLDVQLGATRPFVRADVARLQQVFWNLIKNAVKFTPAGGRVCVRSSDAAAAAAGGRLRVDVSDTGIGIAPEMLTRIFDAFEQGAASITREFGGLGLGLAITKALVEAHGGGLTACSDGPGRGACFTVELATISPGAAAGTLAGGGEGAVGRELKILLVEDHIDTAKVIQRLLGQSGHRVETAGSLAAALAALRAGPVDLVISDVGLPDGSGLDLMREVARRYGVKGIALSGFGTEDDVRRSLAAGFAAHLTKPVPMTALRQAIAKAAAVG